MSRRDDVSLRYVAARREARLVAFAIDGLTLAALAVPFLAVAGLAVLLQSDWLAVDPSGGEWAVGYGIALSWLVAPLIYVTLGTVSGGTVGARWLGLAIRRADGGALGVRRAALRGAFLYASTLLLGGGLLASLFDAQGRPLHDRLAGAQVFETREPGE